MAATWKTIDRRGLPVHTLLAAPEDRLPEGQRLSVQETLVGSIPGPGLTRHLGHAAGIAHNEVGSQASYIKIHVIGSDVDEVIALLAKMERAVGVVDLTPRKISLPDLAGFWERLKFLASWLWTGNLAVE